MENLKIKIKYFEGATKIGKIEKGSWIDLYAAKDVRVYEGERAMIPLGVAMQLPDGYEAHLAPRSSTFKTWGIIQTNSVGVIDYTFMGDGDQWHLPVYCVTPKVKVKKPSFLRKILNVFSTKKKDYRGYTDIKAGDKICQFRIIEEMPNVEFEEVKYLENKDRGGFGSTGTR